MDCDPSLSFDGRTVIFVRRTLIPARFEEPANDQPPKTQIWVAKIDGNKGPEMVFAGPVILEDELGFVGQSEEEAQEFLRDPNRKLRKYPFAAAPLTR
jgi:hypothetical protein